MPSWMNSQEEGGTCSRLKKWHLHGCQAVAPQRRGVLLQSHQGSGELVASSGHRQVGRGVAGPCQLRRE